VARNRKRAKERRARRPQPVASSRRGAGRTEVPPAPAAEPVDGAAAEVEPTEIAPIERGEPASIEPAEASETERIDPHQAVPGPVEDVDGAPSPLAHSAPDVELADAQIAAGSSYVADEEFEREEEVVEEELEEQAEEQRQRALPAAPGERPNLFPRLAGFLQGSWRELQRVQWPDRRQVAQATGVVIGFVIVAGIFLGLSDLVAQKLVNYILK